MRSIKDIAVATAMMAGLMHSGKNERIVGYYNPETDKKRNRNDPCHCGSGLKFKKCCFHTTHEGKEETNAQAINLED